MKDLHELAEEVRDAAADYDCHFDTCPSPRLCSRRKKREALFEAADVLDGWADE